jgi:hypothetical protein
MGGARQREGLGAKARTARALVVAEGISLASLAVWNAAKLFVQPRVSSLFVVIVVVIAALAGVLALATTLMVRGSMVMTRRSRSNVAASLRLQIPVVAVTFIFSLVDAGWWMFGLGAAVAAMTALALMIDLVHHSG